MNLSKSGQDAAGATRLQKVSRSFWKDLKDFFDEVSRPFLEDLKDFSPEPRRSNTLDALKRSADFILDGISIKHLLVLFEKTVRQGKLEGTASEAS